MISSCGKSPRNWFDGISGASFAYTKDGNSMYHQTDLVELQQGTLLVEGELAKGGTVDFGKLYQREVFVKEQFPSPDDTAGFIGAFRYRGYALFDILHPYEVEKANREAFKPEIDLYIEISNDEGERVVFSWSEIFHTTTPGQIIIATAAAPISPGKREVNYDPGTRWKVVAANDLYNSRYLDNPTKITVRSFHLKDYKIQKGMKNMYSPMVRVVYPEQPDTVIGQVTDSIVFRHYATTFYGMGMGFHDQKTFDGPGLASLLKGKIPPMDPAMLKSGLVCFVGLDGYRVVYSYSELFNRADQLEAILALSTNPKDGGFYRNFLPTDFYADRCVKALAEIFFFIV